MLVHNIFYVICWTFPYTLIEVRISLESIRDQKIPVSLNLFHVEWEFKCNLDLQSMHLIPFFMLKLKFSLMTLYKIFVFEQIHDFCYNVQLCSGGQTRLDFLGETKVPLASALCSLLHATAQLLPTTAFPDFDYF